MPSVTPYTGLAHQIIFAQEGATAGSFEKDDLVKTDSAGQVVLATAGKIYGIAQADATGTQNTIVPVMLINPNEIYVIAHKAAATNQNQVGLEADLVYTAGGQNVDSAASTYDEVEIVGFYPDDAVGTSGGRLLVRFQLENTDSR